jgi:hypothetical protein
MRLGAKAGVAVLALVGCLGVWVSAAVAAPANDNFANREVLSGALPIVVAGSNVGATPENLDPSPGGFAFSKTGHSVWFEWEATVSGFVTVGTCGSQIRPVLGVYEGTALGALTEVAGGFASQGPDCQGSEGSAVTFAAESGTTYEIFLDGAQSFPAPNPEGGQGAIALKVEVTPPPPNDDFADATVLHGEVLENGAYAAGSTSGYSWNATKEPGEPWHAGNQGGASVWYAWTAPESGNYGVMACGRFLTSLLGVYAGGSVGSLTQVASDSHSCNVLRFDASAGTTYRIAIDGAYDSGSGQAAMGAVSISVYREPPAPPDVAHPTPLIEAFQPGPPPRPPATRLGGKTVHGAKRRATIRFGSNQAGARFRCRLDRRAFAACASPKTFAGLVPGKHTFQVYAVGAGRVADPTPAATSFWIPKPPGRR